jgi:thioredoxin family protein
MKPIQILVLGSACAVSDFYLEMIEQTVKDLGLSYTIKKTENPQQISEYGVSQGCLYGYCPGCNAINEDRKEHEKYTPALVINGDLVLHSSFPPVEKLKESIKAFIHKAPNGRTGEFI